MSIRQKIHQTGFVFLFVKIAIKKNQISIKSDKNKHFAIFYWMISLKSNRFRENSKFPLSDKLITSHLVCKFWIKKLYLNIFRFMIIFRLISKNFKKYEDMNHKCCKVQSCTPKLISLVTPFLENNWYFVIFYCYVSKPYT